MAEATTTKRRKRRGKGNLLSGFDASVEEQSALDQYLRDVSRHELITPEREKSSGHLPRRVIRMPFRSLLGQTCVS